MSVFHMDQLVRILIDGKRTTLLKLRTHCFKNDPKLQEAELPLMIMIILSFCSLHVCLVCFLGICGVFCPFPVSCFLLLSSRAPHQPDFASTPVMYLFN